MKSFVLFVVIGLLLAGAAAQDESVKTKTHSPSDTPAAKAFERFKSLVGTWKGGVSKDGAECTLTYQLIAGGSVVMETCQFEGQPNSTMVTMYHMDGEHLMLTHYCVARNQPRMRATEFSPDQSTVVFAFIDGTNMSSRDVGHMDKAKFVFSDSDHLSNQWTWYQDGKESWMEQFTFTRQK